MSIIKKVVSILLGISALGVIASTVAIMIQRHNTETVQFTYALDSANKGDVDTSTHITLKNLYDDGYRLDTINYYSTATEITTTYTNVNLSYNDVNSQFSVKIIIDQWFTIFIDDSLIHTGEPFLADQDTFIFTLTKPVLNTTTIILLGLIPTIFVSGLILYINVVKKES